MESFTLPDLLFHYTSQSGLLGIFSSKSIWATNIHYLNDFKEFKHAIDVATTIAWNWSYKTEEGMKDRSYNTFKSLIESISEVNIFVTSFTERGDLLSQWRGYCQGCAGYSIGFEKTAINSFSGKQGFTLTPCIYDCDQQQLIVEEIFKQTFVASIRNKNREHIQEEELNSAIWTFLKSFIEIAPRFKSPAFSEEKEWRLISGMVTTDDRRLSFRCGSSTLIPYIPIDLTTDSSTVPIKEIVVGPNPHMHMSTNAVSNFLSTQGVKGWTVRVSQVPYRNW